MSNPTREQYVDTINSLLAEHNPRLRVGTHAASFADRLVADDTRITPTATGVLLRHYLNDMGLRRQASSLTTVSQALDAYRADARSGGDCDLDRDTVADVIRAFIQSDQPHLTRAGRKGATSEQVDALLQIAGLMDVPVVEAASESASVEDKVDALASVVGRLADFARRHGFRP